MQTKYPRALDKCAAHADALRHIIWTRYGPYGPDRATRLDTDFTACELKSQNYNCVLAY